MSPIKNAQPAPQVVWSRAVRARDAKCRNCGAVEGVLRATRIVPAHVDPARRFELDNGKLLCDRCYNAERMRLRTVRTTPVHAQRRTLLRRIMVLEQENDALKRRLAAEVRARQPQRRERLSDAQLHRLAERVKGRL